MAGDVIAVQDTSLVKSLLASQGSQLALVQPDVLIKQKQLEIATLQRAADAAKNPPAAGCCQESLAMTCIRAHVKAHAYAGAMMSAEEGLRENCWVSLITSTPTTAIGAGASTGTLTVSLPAKTQVGWMVMSQTNSEEFICSSLQFNAWEMNKGGSAVTCAVFHVFLERKCKLLPLVGKFWKGTITISAVFQNTNAATKIFTGLGIGCYNGECVSWTEDLLDEQGFEIWNNALASAQAHALTMGLLN